MKRILFLVNHDVVIYNFRLELVERLLDDGYEVYISSPYGERIDDLIKLGCKYYKVEMYRHGTDPIKEIKLTHYYKQLLKQIKPDIVFTYTIKPNIYGGIACKKLHIPYVANITGLGMAVEKGGLLQHITVALYKYALQKVQKVYFQNTENMYFFLDRKIALGKQGLLPGSGVNLNHFRVLDYPLDETIEFASISRIMKEKGIDQYLDAAKYIHQKYPNTRFHVCGFCEEAYEIRLKELNDKGTIIYHGMVRDIRTILKNIHCTIHPTYYPEGMSNVLLESCACGRPIITTDRSGCREVIDDGVNGYIVKQRDSQDLIEKIEKFLTLEWEQRCQMGLAGRAKVEREFDRQIVEQKYLEEVYKAENRNNRK